MAEILLLCLRFLGIVAVGFVIGYLTATAQTPPTCRLCRHDHEKQCHDQLMAEIREEGE